MYTYIFRYINLFIYNSVYSYEKDNIYHKNLKDFSCDNIDLHTLYSGCKPSTYIGFLEAIVVCKDWVYRFITCCLLVSF